MKLFLNLAALVLLGGSALAQTARLQFIHNSPAPTVDVYVNDALYEGDFAFREATEFRTVPAGVNLKIDVAPYPSTSSADAIFTDNVTLADGETYVAIASGIVGDATTPFGIWYQGGIREAAAASGVDFIGVHGSPDAPLVDIIARDVAILLDDVDYGAISGYLNVPAAAYTLDVTPGTTTSTSSLVRRRLERPGRRAAVVFASGLLTGTPAFGLYAALADGTVVGFPVVAPVFTDVQIIHNAPSPIVDIYVNGTLTVDDFVFQTATPFVPVPADVPVLIQWLPRLPLPQRTRSPISPARSAATATTWRSPAASSVIRPRPSG